MNSIMKAWGTDRSKESDGIWVDVCVNDDDSVARIKVRRMGQSNEAFSKLYAKLGKKFRTMRGDKNKLKDKALLEAFCETCIVGWEHIEDINPKPATSAPNGATVPAPKYMPFNKENAIKLLTAVPDLADHLVNEATELQNFQSESNQELGKN